MTKNENSTKFISERQEKYVANFLDGYVQPGSGNGKFKKSDVVVKDFLVECKTAMTEKSQFTIKKDWLEKLKLEALANHKSMYALAFNFGGEEKHNYFVINEQQFKLLKDLYSEKFSN